MVSQAALKGRNGGMKEDLIFKDENANMVRYLLVAKGLNSEAIVWR